MRHELGICGNKRDVMREYPGRKRTASRLFPDIPAYSRITGLGDFLARKWQRLVASSHTFFTCAYVDLSRWKSNLHRRKSRYIAINRRNGLGNFFAAKQAEPGHLKMQRTKCKFGSARRRVRPAFARKLRRDKARGLLRRLRHRTTSHDLVPHDSTSAFAPTPRHDKQGVDISSKTAENRVASRLISRRLRRRPSVSDPFNPPRFARLPTRPASAKLTAR
jgi:hypothetical protein